MNGPDFTDYVEKHGKPPFNLRHFIMDRWWLVILGIMAFTCHEVSNVFRR